MNGSDWHPTSLREEIEINLINKMFDLDTTSVQYRVGNATLKTYLIVTFVMALLILAGSKSAGTVSVSWSCGVRVRVSGSTEGWSGKEWTIHLY